MNEKDNTQSQQDQFVQDWLKIATVEFPGSEVVEAVAAATKLSQLDETKLGKQLRYLSLPPIRENAEPD